MLGCRPYRPNRDKCYTFPKLKTRRKCHHSEVPLCMMGKIIFTVSRCCCGDVFTPEFEVILHRKNSGNLRFCTIPENCLNMFVDIIV